MVDLYTDPRYFVHLTDCVYKGVNSGDRVLRFGWEVNFQQFVDLVYIPETWVPCQI